MEISPSELQEIIDKEVAKALAKSSNPLLATVKQQEIKTEIPIDELMKPMSPFDELSDEEILYWSSDYYDELQAQKQKPKENIE
jgi:hypothetical protein